MIIHPDNAEVVRAFLKDFSVFGADDIDAAKLTIDPQVDGVWKAEFNDSQFDDESKPTCVIVYGLGTDDPDFEEVEV
jgi:hypothetical protein